MDNSATTSKGTNWIRILGIVTAVGLLIAVGRIVLRVFREKPVADNEHHEAA